MRSGCALLCLVSALVACERGPARARVGKPALPIDPGPAMEPLAPLARPRVAPSTASPEPELRVIARTSSLGWHRFYSVDVALGPWGPATDESPGDEALEAMGRTFERCATHDGLWWCPAAGFVAWARQEQHFHVEERVIALHRDGVTWSENACAALHLLGAEARASLCEHRLRTLGADPRGGVDACRWQFMLDAPHGDRTPVVVLRLDRDRTAVEQWAGEGHTWLARGDRWTAAVQIDRAACGEREGAGAAARILELAPQ